MNDPLQEAIAKLQTLTRYKPRATFSITGDSDQHSQPRFAVSATMFDTGNAVSTGTGEFVTYYDVLTMLIKLNKEMRKR